jgi:hypothetical protein
MSSTNGKSVHHSEPTASATRKADIGLLAALSIGVGGMIGAGIFSILGVVARVAGSAMPLSFAIGGVVAGLAAYSYVALGKTFPSVGGAVTFLVRGYGEGVASGSLNLFQYFSYIITIALYATRGICKKILGRLGCGSNLPDINAAAGGQAPGVRFLQRVPLSGLADVRARSTHP